MSEYIWIKDTGETQETEMMEDVLGQISGDSLFLACSTDSFQAGHAVEGELIVLKPEKLLELRIFSKEQEICYRRSCIGERFQWRIATEENCILGNDYLIQYQTLDINEKRVEKEGNPVDENGNRILYTTVGGKYKLPLNGYEDSAKIISYIVYDRNGMAKIADYRLCGFVQKNVTVKMDKEN